MKLTVDTPIFVVAPEGRIRGINDLTFCPDEKTAQKVKEEEFEMSGVQMIILEARISIPVKMIDGDLFIAK